MQGQLTILPKYFQDTKCLVLAKRVDSWPGSFGPHITGLEEWGQAGVDRPMKKAGGGDL